MLLMRHGESEFNAGLHDRPDPRLTGAAVEMARAIAQGVAERFSRVLCSPYTRALQTAEIMAMGKPIMVTPLIGEHFVGDHEAGSPLSVLASTWPGVTFTDIQEKWWPDTPEDEAALDARVSKFRKWVEANLYGQRWLVVSHHGFLRAFTGIGLPNLGYLRAATPWGP